MLQDDRFRATAERYLGRPIEIDVLRELVADTIAFARQAKFPATDVVVPEQEVIGELAKAEAQALLSRDQNMPLPETAIQGVYANEARAQAGKSR